MVETLLDAAFAAMQAEDADDEARRRFYERLTGTELFLLLDAEPVDDKISPHVFDLSDHSFVLAFDQEHRLSQFTGITSPYAALSGRVICQMLAPQGLGMGFNLDVAPSSILLPPEAVQWLAEMDATPEEITAKVQAFAAPTGLPEAFLQILDTRLAAAEGLADLAYLVQATYENGATGHMLGIINARPSAEEALAHTVAQALVFSGLEAGSIDVGFFQASDPTAASLARCGLRFDLPQAEVTLRAAPGSNPDKPPILR
ncbi:MULTISPECIES: SseB family protein [unclassified Roseovarius]|uniref:SseB family protein n=1 Tax=unclassified Roseovarius TaxID=2614913 RepID=UPI00273F5E36|nr:MULTISPECIES: SseB family protein [unclassified Roseovarius]